MIRRKHIFLLAKLAIGALVIYLILRQLTPDDEVSLASGTTVGGRNLSVVGEARIRSKGVWKGVPVERAAILKQSDGSYTLEARSGAGLERFTGDAIEFAGTATLDDGSGALRTFDLAALKPREDGKGPIRISPGFKFGLRSILGRLDDRPGFGVAAFAFMALAYAAGILRWRLLLETQGLSVSFWRAMQLTFIGFFFNNVMPGLTGGDIVKAVMIAQDHPEERPAAVGTVIVDRVLGLLVLAVMSATVLAFTFRTYAQAAVAVFGFLGAAAMGLVLFFSRRVRSALRLDELIKKLPGAGTLKKLDRAFFLYRSQKKAVLFAVLLSVVAHCGTIGTAYCFGRGIGLDESAGLQGNPLVAYIATVPIILIVSSVPVLPGGWGVGEAAFAYFFRTVGIWNIDLSIGLSVIQRTATLLFSLLGGVFFLTFRKKVMAAVHESGTAEAAP